MFYVICGGVTLCLFIMVAVLFMGAFTKYYPYEWGSRWNISISSESTGGIQSFINSVVMSLLSAIAGTAFVFIYVYLVERSKSSRVLKVIGRLLSSIPLALPGMVHRPQLHILLQQP